MKSVIAAIAIGIAALLLEPPPAQALHPSLQISQYGHTSWKVRDGFSLGTVFAMAQTPDGYLWLGSGFGLFRFDGVRFVRWRPPGDEQRPIQGAYSLLSARDGTLWIGMFEGLASWRDGHLTRFPEFDGLFVTSLLEDRDGTVWVGGIHRDNNGRLCAVRDGRGRVPGRAATSASSSGACSRMTRAAFGWVRIPDSGVGPPTSRRAIRYRDCGSAT